MRTSFSAIIATLAMLAQTGLANAKPAPSSRDPLTVDCGRSQDCPTVPVPRWSATDGRRYRCADVIDDHGLEITPIQLALLCDRSSGECPNLRSGAVWLICPGPDGGDVHYDPRDYGIKHPKDIARKLPASCRRYLRVGLNHRNLARGIAPGITIPTNLSPCQQGEAACTNYVSALERQRDEAPMRLNQISAERDKLKEELAQLRSELQAAQAQARSAAAAGSAKVPAASTVSTVKKVILGVVSALVVVFMFVWVVLTERNSSRERAQRIQLQEGVQGCLAAYTCAPDPALMRRMEDMPVAVLILFTKLVKSRRVTEAESTESLEDAEHRLANPVYAVSAPSSSDVDEAFEKIMEEESVASESPPGRLDEHSARILRIEMIVASTRKELEECSVFLDGYFLLRKDATQKEKRERKIVAMEVAQRLREIVQRFEEETQSPPSN